MKITDINNINDFKELESRECNGGIQYQVRFKNNYGASIVKHHFSYGNEGGLWELAVLKFNDDGSNSLCYDTKITDDVLGNLSDSDVNKTIKDIAKLTREIYASLN